MRPCDRIMTSVNVADDSAPPGVSSESSPRQSPRHRRWLWALVLLAVFTGAVYSLRTSILSAAGQWLNVTEPLKGPVDYVFILGGDADTRPFAAAALVKGGLARQVLIARAEGEPESDSPGEVSRPHHVLLRQILLQRGVPSASIIALPMKVSSTADEAEALRAFLKQEPQKSVAVITSDYHTRRTRATFRRRLGKEMDRVQVIGAPTERFNGSNWWHYDQGTKLYINEYLKMLYDIL